MGLFVRGGREGEGKGREGGDGMGGKVAEGRVGEGRKGKGRGGEEGVGCGARRTAGARGAALAKDGPVRHELFYIILP